jgi:hypothetical protein
MRLGEGTEISAWGEGTAGEWSGYELGGERRI